MPTSNYILNRSLALIIFSILPVMWIYTSYLDYASLFLHHAQLDRSAFKSDITAFANAAHSAFAKHCSPELYDTDNRQWLPPCDIWASARELQASFVMAELERTLNNRQSGVVWSRSCWLFIILFLLFVFADFDAFSPGTTQPSAGPSKPAPESNSPLKNDAEPGDRPQRKPRPADVIQSPNP
ncbi:hypothetical protein BCR35DRAFT_331180 [Leucosporidium creatinivorum]|uniref:Uncharacterized protein n=1 Tax=Leucosporidium creatinivorum TaxID=106004 RepID=A0A1Y2FHW1_9BASI|nr:hypothetical protein BCR35DRAFT_331180 [Leucosporidium creatinivorum]